jgi:hypothetical protein
MKKSKKPSKDVNIDDLDVNIEDLNNEQRISLLKFEYQELREENKRNTRMNYVIISVFFGASLVIISNTYAEYYKCCSDTQICLEGLLGPYIFSLLLMSIALLIDKRLTAFNKIRSCRMYWLEERLGIFNKRLTLKAKDKKEIKDEDTGIVLYELYDTADFLSGIKEVTKWPMNFFLKMRVSDYFLLLFIAINIGWGLLFQGDFRIFPFGTAFFAAFYFLVEKVDC